MDSSTYAPGYGWRSFAGVLLIPALTELFKVEPRKAAGMTLAAMVPPVTLPGAWRYYNQGFLGADDNPDGCVTDTG